jgi:uncharacterized membrane protein YhaH (DUF805 family)
MEMIEAYKRAMHRYADFNGRATRSEFWLYVLAVMLMFIAVGALESILFFALTGGVLSMLVQIVHFVPSLSTAARRLHDSGKSAWWLLLILLPAVGFIVLIIFYCTPSDPAPNKYASQ